MRRAWVMCLCAGLLFSSFGRGDIYNWNSGQVISGTGGITPGPGVNLSNWNSDTHNLRYADFSGGLDLSNSSFRYSWLDGARFTGANLTGASFDTSTLTDADLNGATVVGANFSFATLKGFTKEMLYSTASYQNRDLHGIGLGGNNLSGWNFANQNLAGADLSSGLKDADLSGANLAGALFKGANLVGTNLSGANLNSADFFMATLTNTSNLTGVNLTDAKFEQAKLINADLRGVNLTGADFYLATLTGADLSGATVAGANFSRSVSNGLTQSQLYSTASYQNGDLHGIDLRYNNLNGWNFANQNLAGAKLSAGLMGANLSGANLTGADFYAATLTDTDLSGANLAGADFYAATLTDADLSGANLAGASFNYSTLTNANLSGAFVAGAAIGLTQSQLYSTASYQTGDLHGIKFLNGDMIGWNFANQNLTGADFGQFMLFTSDLSGADMRGAKGVWWWMGVIAKNTIWENGHIQGLGLTAGDVLKIRDYDGGIGITIDSGMKMADGAILDIVLSDAAWGSTILVDAGIVPDLGGILKLEFAAGINPADLVGTTFDLFDWNGTLLSGECFGQVVSLPGVGWDLSSLYTTGEVTLTAVPEPAGLLLLGLGGLALRNRRQ